MTDLFLPLLLACTAGYALYRRVDLFPTLLCGVEKGLHTALHILPTMIVILTAVRMLRVSGFVDLMGTGLSAAAAADRHSGRMRGRCFCSSQSAEAAGWRSDRTLCASAA